MRLGAKKNRCGRTPAGIPPHRFTFQRVPWHCQVALYLVIRKAVACPRRASRLILCTTHPTPSIIGGAQGNAMPHLVDSLRFANFRCSRWVGPTATPQSMMVEERVVRLPAVRPRSSRTYSDQRDQRGYSSPQLRAFFFIRCTNQQQSLSRHGKCGLGDTAPC